MSYLRSLCLFACSCALHTLYCVFFISEHSLGLFPPTLTHKTCYIHDDSVIK
jgi:hypothetical protein